MIISKKHYEEYKETFTRNATKIYSSIEDASKDFAKAFNANEEVAKEIIERNSNADWIVAPDGKVFMLYDLNSTNK